jgi:hypothetical protein
MVKRLKSVECWVWAGAHGIYSVENIFHKLGLVVLATNVLMVQILSQIRGAYMFLYALYGSIKKEILLAASGCIVTIYHYIIHAKSYHT